MAGPAGARRCRGRNCGPCGARRGGARWRAARALRWRWCRRGARAPCAAGSWGWWERGRVWPAAMLAAAATSWMNRPAKPPRPGRPPSCGSGPVSWLACGSARLAGAAECLPGMSWLSRLSGLWPVRWLITRPDRPKQAHRTSPRRAFPAVAVGHADPGRRCARGARLRRGRDHGAGGGFAPEARRAPGRPLCA